MIFRFKDITTGCDPRVVYNLRVVKETDDGFILDCFGKYKEVKRKDIEIAKEEE